MSEAGAQQVRRRGRPTNTVPTGYEHLQQWLAEPYDGSAGELSNSSKNRQQLVWRCMCGIDEHCRLLAVKSVIRSEQRRATNPGRSHALYCRVCGEPDGMGNRGSQHERALYDLLSSSFSDLVLHIESKVLGSRGPTKADIYLPDEGLAIYVDGEHHFSGQGVGGQHGEGSSTQARRDAAVDALVKSGKGLQHGVVGVLRLHYADVRVW
eukprot:CAMPEP_0202863068 /NCGR_PEP_ID=MMETSP1391-20130828/3859_1 /ASSEMBLY_ACC=CAM_ASM_000867 /TAXON_ID=1034604 /ORGANISM="Chlamydomonas leiostraca, Strain SAG 11-49" /LENGTH=208 /DNA_ID=CAMNT_0049542665 /DNA_START=130 /DNA_END=753 /DNA_ORIENTATION=-